MPLSCRLVQPAHDLKHRDPSCCCACVQVSPRLVGLALGHVLNLTGTMQWAVRQTAEAENNMTRRARLQALFGNLGLLSPIPCYHDHVWSQHAQHPSCNPLMPLWLVLVIVCPGHGTTCLQVPA